MKQINEISQEVVLTSTNGKQNSIQLNRPAPNWLPDHLISDYNSTDLDYEFCVKLFFQLEAAKREKLPQETARQFFVEFVRRGWTKTMLQKRYDALLATKIYGIEKLEIADFINAVPVYALDEVNLMVEQRVNSLIQRGRLLRGKQAELTDDDKKAIDLAVAKEIELGYQNSWYEARDTYQAERKKRILGL